MLFDQFDLKYPLYDLMSMVWFEVLIKVYLGFENLLFYSLVEESDQDY